jgi:Fic family protein
MNGLYMENVIVKINELLQELQSLLPMKPEWQRQLDKKFRLEFNYNSNHLEGNTLTYGETELLLFFGKTRNDHTKQELDEMEAHDDAIGIIKNWAEDKEHPLTETDIKNLNRIILVRPFWKEAVTPDGNKTQRLIKIGDYKKAPNSVRMMNGNIFEYASVTDTPILMGELVDWYRTEEEKNEIHPVILAATLHYKFVRIHPFDDGNGRVARLLTNYILFKNDFPPVIVKSTDKRNYLTALNKADTGDLNSFIKYIGEQLIWSLELSIKAAKGESIEEQDDLDKELALLRRQLNSEDIIKKKGNVKDISDTLVQNIFPLFMLIEEKCNSLKEFFVDTTRNISYDTEGGNNRQQVHPSLMTWEQINNEWYLPQIMNQAQKITYLKYDFALTGFKKNVIAGSEFITIEVYFNDFNFTMLSGNNELSNQQFAYGAVWNEADLLKIVSPVIRRIIENIKRTNGMQH